MTASAHRAHYRLKRVLDLLLTIPALIALSPVILLLAAMVRITQGSPVFFRQKRAGCDGQIFDIVKFRTMTDARDAQDRLMPDEQRMTGFGQWLRSTSLDELPELWNVVRGEMSLVGPRPLMSKYLALYSPEQARRHEALPGITGWAQVNGRNALTWEDKFKLDVWYVDHQSIGLDCRILMMTVGKLLKREGISQAGHATAPEFTGSGGEQLASANSPSSSAEPAATASPVSRERP